MAMECCDCAVRCITALSTLFLKNIGQKDFRIWGQTRNAPTTAYDFLRIRGVPIGKLDFLGQMRLGF
jgi:hypothetical protein